MTPTDLPGGDKPGVAPRRAVPLKTEPPPSTPKAPPGPELPFIRQRSSLETKIAAAGGDANQILRTLDTELALHRAGRSIKGSDQVKAMRVLSVAMLFTLLIAALGAMSYLQTQLIGHGFRHRPTPAVNASPTPGPSAPDAPPTRQSARPTR